MRSINPKCSNNVSFKYSILISLHYYDLNSHPERINKLNKYINKYNFSRSNYRDFENNNQSIPLTGYNENKKIIYTTKNNTSYLSSIIPSSPSLALAFEVCLAGLMLVVAVFADLVLGLTLIVATP